MTDIPSPPANISDASPEPKPGRWLFTLARPVRGWLLAGVIHGAFMEGVERAALAMPLLLIAGLLILRGASAWLRDEAGFHAGARVRLRLRAELLEKLGGL